jgi:RNase P/RNase MRP subunit POP5
MKRTATNNPDKRAELLVQSEPRIDDPRELWTILQTSLKALFGDMEPHSYDLSVTKEDNSNLLLVNCRNESVAAVRAALTMATPPPYLESTVYCLDVISIR